MVGGVGVGGGEGTQARRRTVVIAVRAGIAVVLGGGEVGVGERLQRLAGLVGLVRVGEHRHCHRCGHRFSSGGV